MNLYFKWQCLLLYFTVMPCTSIWAQKPVIDARVYGKWPELEFGRTIVSNDGNYVMYLIQNQPVGSSTTVIKAIHADWKRELVGNVACSFSKDSRTYIFASNDSLGIGDLGKPSVNYIPGVNVFKLYGKDENDNWLVYQLKDFADQLVLRDIHTATERRYERVKDYWFGEKTQQLVLEIPKDNIQQLQLVDLNTSKTSTIWSGKLIGYPRFDASGTQLAFVGADQQGNNAPAIFYFKVGAEKAVKIIDQNSPGIEKGDEIREIKSLNDKIICFSLQKTEHTVTAENGLLAVDIYSYKDAKLQSEQLAMQGHTDNETAVVDITNRQILVIERKGMKLLSSPDEAISNQGYVLVSKYDDGGTGAGSNEWNWECHAKNSAYLFSLKDSSLRPVKKSVQGFIDFNQSPNGQYIIYFEPTAGNYFSYEAETGKTRNITKGIHTNWTPFDENGNDERIAKYTPVGIAGYLQDGRTVLIYDQRDIYQVDLSGNKEPKCLTNYVGRKQNTEFRIALYDFGNHSGIIQNDETLLINAFNHITKEDGFYRIKLNLQKDPEYVSMQPVILDGIDEYEVGGKSTPVKAHDAEVYIVQRQNASEAPNLFYTSDFRSFKRLTDIAPQRTYNWLTSELINWKTFNGTASQGILFKPENFDPKKKYPVIFFYYERYSNSLHRFLMPEANGATIGIPTFVSNGYLVFIPDVHYPPGTGQGPGCYNAVVSAAQSLSKMSWVDSKRMGINGHSRGGFQTNYLITHTNLFAAAVSASGYSDAVSLYTRIRNSGDSGEGSYELTHQRIDATLWQKPEVYFENSPILKADRVTTPVLMMNNKMDNDIPFQQGAEFFTALRRLGKRAWMLQYDGEGHVLLNESAARDFEIRMQQFLDYYLKGARPPVWMTCGIPAERKQIDSGLQFDNSGAIP